MQLSHYIKILSRELPMLKKFTVTAVAAALLTTTGCASIVSDSTYPVSIRSNPDN